MECQHRFNVSRHGQPCLSLQYNFLNINLNLKKRGNIQRPVAMVLMFVLLICMAPKTWFHDLVARHKDVSSCREKYTTTVLHNNSYHCHFNDLVVSVPFIKFSFHLQLAAPSSFAENETEFYSFILTGYSHHPENR